MDKGTRLGQILLATPRFKGNSPLGRTPLTSTMPEVPLNDDEAERRQRRRENHLKNVMSPGCHTPRSASHYPERLMDITAFLIGSWCSVSFSL